METESTLIHAPAPGAFPAGAGAQVVFPPDTRVQVHPTTMFPAQCVGQLTVQFPNGRQYIGTGTLVDEFRVLTCAHVLYSAANGGMATQVSFAPGRDGANDPYGEFAFAAGGIAIPDEFRNAPAPIPGEMVANYTRYLYDFGMVTLGAAVGLDQFPGPHWVGDAQLAPLACSITGYPDDKPAGTMWQADGQVQTEDTGQFLFYQISTWPGQSGSAVMCALPNLPVPAIVGIHVAGTHAANLETNFAVRLNADVLQVINGWG